MVLSFDFDGTLSKPRTQKFARYLREIGHEIWIVTSRLEEGERYRRYGMRIDNADLYHVALNLGIPVNQIHFTNQSLKSKFFFGRPQFFMHFENDPFELEHLYRLNLHTIDVRESFWINKAMTLINSGKQEVKARR